MRVFNTEIKNRIKENRIPMAELAYTIGVTESTLYRWFRVPLGNGQAERVNAAIDKIIKGEV